MKREIKIFIDDTEIAGTLVVPEGASGIVLFAHGGGSSRFSPRNVFVAEKLQEQGFGTLLIDLLTEKEDEAHETRFDIALLTERLSGIVRSLAEEKETKDLAVGLFGSSTGAAAALRVASRLGERVVAVVSRGGRPDLAMEELPEVVSPTLLIVGGNDSGVIELNEKALAALRSEKKLEIVPGATHLFEERGALEEVARLAAEWFALFLFPTRSEGGGNEIPEMLEEMEEEGNAKIPPRFRDEAEKPTQPPGKTRDAAKEGYRHFHRK
ncbi:MAG: dienelactone hydrolase family protein [Patescibacteria group bacterium]|nr:MAG: dienelactone hydrolase family protein [Patescibacteria group bacterium]